MSAIADDILKALAEAGVQVLLPAQQHLCLTAAAAALDCSPKWVREHLHLFPNAWRMEGGSGELRIPSRDIEAYARSRKLNRTTA